MPKHIQAILSDIDGVLVVDRHPLPGVSRALERLRAAGLPLRFLTNATVYSHAEVHAHLVAARLDIRANELFTVGASACRVLRQLGARTVLALTGGPIRQDLAGFNLVSDPVLESILENVPDRSACPPLPTLTRQAELPDAILLGDIGQLWTHLFLERLFELAMAGVPVLALHKGRFWKTAGRNRMDLGAYVAALEHTAGITARIAGKPSPDHFLSALESVPCEADKALMIGDDVHSDVCAAQSLGMAGVLVKTGKYEPGHVERSGVQPDAVLSSFADLPDWLEL